MRDYIGELHIEDNGDGTSTVTWTGEFEVTRGHEAEPKSGLGEPLLLG